MGSLPDKYQPLDLSEGRVNTLGLSPVGGESLADETARRAAEIENEQAWYQTLGIGTDEDTTTFFGGVADQFTSGGNFAVDLWNDVTLAADHEYDPEFDAPKWALENQQKYNIPDEYLGSFGRSGSEAESMQRVTELNTRRDAQERIQRMGITGQFMSGMIAGMVDLDTIATGGTMLIGKTGIQATKMGRALTGASAAASGAALGTLASPEDDYQNIALAAIIGGVLPTVLPDGKPNAQAARFNEHLSKAADDLDETILRKQRETPDVDTQPAQPWTMTKEVEEDAVLAAEKAGESVSQPATVFDPAEIEIAVESAAEGGSTVGAKQRTQPGQQTKLQDPSKDVQDVISDSKKYVRDTGIATDYEAAGPGATKGGVAGWTANTMQVVTDTLGTIGLITDFDRMMRTGGATAQKVAHTFMLDPSGRLTNRNAAAIVRTEIKQRFDTLYHHPMIEAQNSFLRRQGVQMWNLAERNRHLSNFNKQIILEQENLRLNGAYSQNADPDVVRAATAINDAMQYDLRIGKEADVPGYRDTPDTDGYFERRMTGRSLDNAMHKLRANGRAVSEKDVEDMWTDYYHSMSGLSRADARKVAASYMGRARTHAEGGNTRLWELLSDEGDEFMRQTLRRQGASDKQIDRIMKVLIGKSEERGKQGHMKGRIDGDIRMTARNGLRPIDFIESDVERILRGRSRKTSGRAAMAKAGVRTSHDWQKIKDAIKAEQRAMEHDDSLKPVNMKERLGARTTVDDKYLDEIWDYFAGTGNLSDTGFQFANRMKRATVLSTMSGLGLTQLAETGPLLAYAGFKDFVANMPAALKESVTNPRSDLVQEMRSIGLMQPEERLFNQQLAADLDMSLTASKPWVQYMDQAMGLGLKWQSVMSGMNKVRLSQQKMAMMVTMDKTLRALAGKGGKTLTPDRLLSIGIDQKLLDRLEGIMQHVEWEGNHVRRLNIDKWNDEQLVSEFSRTMQIATDQLVQKAHLGESNIIFSNNGYVSMMTQFLSYPLTAINKQAARNAYIGDPEAFYQTLAGIASAGMVGMSKNVIAGRYDRLTPAEFMRYGFVQSNLTGWVPLIADPILHMFGQDKLAFNPYGDVLRTPPAISVVSNTLKSPLGIFGLLDGDISAQDARHLRHLPLIGNWYPMTALVQRMK